MQFPVLDFALVLGLSPIFYKLCAVQISSVRLHTTVFTHLMHSKHHDEDDVIVEREFPCPPDGGGP